MQRPSPIRRGDIYWLDDCPPLEGQVLKRRPVIVISPKTHIDSGGDILLVAVSTSVLPTDKDRIPLPNKQDEPQTRSGLPKPCWAVPRWYLFVDRARLSDRAGYLGIRLIETIFVAVMKHLDT